MSNRIRIVIVDDSLFMRSAIKKLVEAAGDFEVVGMARDGEEAVESVRTLQPDVVTMDFNMPRMNGAQAVKAIMAAKPTPILMFSAHTRQGARETFEALSAGAVDFVTKPGGEVSADLEAIADELLNKLRGAAGARPQPAKTVERKRTSKFMKAATLPPTGPRVIIIGISTGGPAALSELLPRLPATMRSPIVIVQHMPAEFTAALAERLDGMSPIQVREAAEGDIPRSGTVLIAPGDRHLEFDDAGHVHLSSAPPVHGCRPAADVTMRSAAAVFRRRAVGLVMTGMGRDGTEGLAAIRGAEGATYAQEQSTCIIAGMPRSAIESGVVDHVVALGELAGTLQSL